MAQRLLLTLVCVSSLAAFGGAYRWITLPLFSLVCLTLLVDLPAVREGARRHRLLDATLILGCLSIAAQLIPLPAPVVNALSPQAARVKGSIRLDYPFAGDAWQPISTNPEATWHALGIALSATIAFFIARGVFARGGVRRFCRTLAFAGLVVSFAAIIQRATSPSLIYGFWRPFDPNANPYGPFVNRNHFAAWLLMAAFVVAGYSVTHARIHLGAGGSLRRTIRSIAMAGTHIYVTAALTMAVTIVLTLSRSALAGLSAGVVLAAIVARHRSGSGGIRHAAVATTVVALGVAVMLAYVDVDRLAGRIDETVAVGSAPRLVIWRETMPLVRDFWLTGVGAGAYSEAILLYQRTDLHVHFNQAHSHYVQLAAEGGLLLGVPWLLAAVVFVHHVRRAHAHDRTEIYWIRLGAACGVAAIAVQSIWETPLRMGANAILVALIGALALHQRDRR